MTPVPVPSGVGIPDEVRTQLGTFRFFDGFPDEATTRMLFHNLNFKRDQVHSRFIGLLDNTSTSYCNMWLGLHDGVGAANVVRTGGGEFGPPPD